MLDFLFRRLTNDAHEGAALFDALTAEARRPHWYVEGQVPDTLDGRFAVLSTVTALALIRLEQFGDEGNRASVALTERFIAVMESEHRELGLGDPTLGKTVRKLVGKLSRRVDLWRSAVADQGSWTQATEASLYKGGGTAEAFDHSSRALQQYWSRVSALTVEQMMKGSLG